MAYLQFHQGQPLFPPIFSVHRTASEELAQCCGSQSNDRGMHTDHQQLPATVIHTVMNVWWRSHCFWKLNNVLSDHLVTERIFLTIKFNISICRSYSSSLKAMTTAQFCAVLHTTIVPTFKSSHGNPVTRQKHLKVKWSQSIRRITMLNPNPQPNYGFRLCLCFVILFLLRFVRALFEIKPSVYYPRLLVAQWTATPTKQNRKQARTSRLSEITNDRQNKIKWVGMQI